MSLFENDNTGAKTPSLQFKAPGAKHRGTITRISKPVQAKEFGTDTPATWRSGNPKMQVCVTLQTGEVHPDGEKFPDHNGEWGLWVLNDFGFFPGSMLDAVQKAVAAAKADDLEVGGELAVEFYGTDPESKNPQNPRKLYRAEYRPPAAGGGLFTKADEAAAPAHTPASGGAPAPEAVGIPEATVTMVRTMLDAGVTADKVATATGLTAAQVAAVAEDTPPF